MLNDFKKEILEELQEDSPIDSNKFPKPKIKKDLKNFNVLDKTNNVEDQSNIDGNAAVVDQKINVVDPLGNGKFPTIDLGQNVEVIVNGIKISNKTVVSSQDEIMVVPDFIEPGFDYKITVDDALMTAYLTVTYKRGQKYKVVNTKGKKDLVISAQLEEELLPPKLQYDTVRQELAQKGVFNFDEFELMKVLGSDNDLDNEIIAQGIKQNLL